MTDPGAAGSDTSSDGSSPDDGPGPLQALRVMAAVEVAVTDSLDHLELYTPAGLLTLLWHGRADHEAVVLMVGGALGGMLGPAHAAYHELGVDFAAEGIGTIRVDYRAPNDLDACVHDTLAAAELAARRGARRFVVIGHSFGGAVAVRAGVALGGHTAGVVTLATQAPGCEIGDELRCPALHLHGDLDTILAPMSSEVVGMVTEGEVVMLAGAGHLLDEAAEELRERLRAWVPARFAEHAARS